MPGERASRLWTHTRRVTGLWTPTCDTVAVSRRLHRAWFVAAVTLLVLILSAAFRSSYGVMIVPLEAEFGWPTAATSLAVAVNLVFYGLTAPFAAALMERFGIRLILVLALALISIGTALTVAMTAAWQLVALWGVVVGLGVGATALVFSTLIANRWFAKNRGLVMGVFGTAFATGQLVFLPAISAIIESSGWRAASWFIATMAAALIPLVWLVVRDRPSAVGLRPYGAEGDASALEASTNSTRSGVQAARSALATLKEASRTRPFWMLAGTFAICGWTTNGIVSTHFVPTMHDHGMGATTAAGLLAIVGIFDIIGTIGSGWLTDRFDPRVLLGVYYALRGVALITLPVILGPHIAPPLILVMILFGLDWVATVPPTVALCRDFFGVEKGSIVFGWVFAAHMVGAAFAAVISGALRDVSGSYWLAWTLSGVLAMTAAVVSFNIPRLRSTLEPQPAH